MDKYRLSIYNAFIFLLIFFLGALLTIGVILVVDGPRVLAKDEENNIIEFDTGKIESIDIVIDAEKIREEQEAVICQTKICLLASGYSYDRLYNWLTEYYGFSPAMVREAIAACDVDWNQEAVECAQKYITYNKKKYNYDTLKSQLEYEKFTEEQIEYALNEVGLKAE